VESWTNENHPLVCYVRYEDLLDKAIKTFRRAASIVGINDSGLIKQALRKSSFDEMRRQETKSGFVERIGESSLFFREGRKDQWRQHLTPEQVERVIDKNRVQMERFKYIPRAYKS
jgi:hypothetical protein